ncbi:sulfotransferase domain-containing protein [Jidongwangia harbinensis]|uniref:sulfotransferase domain-containing protein n=1 Tax=Jidongwangia harbinensis TaxID=2878561 RepID=UPI001CD967E2|nr:sulfotransferase domain-containing protein [Jidongwangia harbinensis]MCA2212757.1 sulfotransferase domain-containing protein [Jidongwangia harbinensis]
MTHKRYVSSDEDSARFRDGDIVISTRSKSGTTWMQMICALLIFQTPRLPAPLPTLSPWLDWLVEPRDEVIARLAAQPHRRFVKTHTPLDGVPIDPRATYIVVARHPLDLAVSLFHQGANLDRQRLAALTGTPAGVERPAPPVLDALLSWIDHDPAPADELDSLPGVMWHLSDAWRRRHEPNVLLVHYADLSADLDGEMRRIAARLGVPVPAETWPELVDAAGFSQMRARAGELAPDPAGVLKDRNAFFRSGRSGAGRDLLSDEQYAHYLDRTAALGPPDLRDWLHR